MNLNQTKNDIKQFKRDKPTLEAALAYTRMHSEFQSNPSYFPMIVNLRSFEVLFRLAENAEQIEVLQGLMKNE